MPDKWFNVNKDIRVWAGHTDAHRQGWIYAPAAIFAIDQYQGSYQFKEIKFEGDGYADLKDDSNYPQYWVREEDVSLEPYSPDPNPLPGPVPIPVPTPGQPGDAELGDAELGAAVRLLANFIRVNLLGR